MIQDNTSRMNQEIRKRPIYRELHKISEAFSDKKCQRSSILNGLSSISQKYQHFYLPVKTRLRNIAFAI